jgi:UDP-N-acetylglucosamine--dolichyl-phosphate N-acetylglucosaminephosphotransferase
MIREHQLKALLLVGLLPPAAAIAALRSWHIGLSLTFAAIISLLGYRWTVFLIPLLQPRHVRAGLVGKDINKKGTEAGDRPVPESLGLAPGVVCITCFALIQLAHTLRLVSRACLLLGIPTECEEIHGVAWADDFPAALASMAFMLMLGFVDDVLDLPWRVKLVMPVVASLPLLAAYSGATAIAIPKPIVQHFSLQQTYIELGPLYFGYMVLLVIFCTNAINILAGVNGLEAGQSYIVGTAILTHNILQLTRSYGAQFALGLEFQTAGACYFRTS